MPSGLRGRVDPLRDALSPPTYRCTTENPSLPRCRHRPPSVSRERPLPLMDITLYSKPFCVQCDATKRALNKAGIAYDVVDITEDAEALAMVKSLGYVQAPVVSTAEDHWSGCRPDKNKAPAGHGAESRVAAAVGPLRREGPCTTPTVGGPSRCPGRIRLAAHFAQ